MTVMRAEVGKLLLDNVFRERANLNMAIVGKDNSLPYQQVRLGHIWHDKSNCSQSIKMQWVQVGDTSQDLRFIGFGATLPKLTRSSPRPDPT
jgi:hypothetical protein